MVSAALALALGSLAGAAKVRAETLKYEVSLFGIEVGELTAKVQGTRIHLDGETSGALVLFFPAKERVVIDTKGGKPVVITRTFDHGGKKGVWKLTFSKRNVELHRNDDKVKDTTVHYKIPDVAYDPASALQKLRTLAPAKKVSLLVFGVDAIYRFTAKRISLKPLHYRGTYQPVTWLRKRKKRPQAPPWLMALGLGKGATKRPELNIWLSDDARRIPTRIRMTDPRGAAEITLTEPALTTAGGEGGG